MYNDKSLKNILQTRCDHEPEFHQALFEFGQDILPFIEGNAEYCHHRVLERLIEPDRIISFRVTWQDDQGGIHVNRGYRVQHCNAIGPYKGGLRFHPTVNLSILKFLAFEQTFKNALTGMAMGGAKGGADFDPKGKSDTEIMRFCQSFMVELHRHIGPNTDVPAGDIGVGQREIGYLYGQYKRLANEFTGALTGKNLNFGGSEVRMEATGYGLVYFMHEMLKHHNDSLEGKQCLVSGSGNVAQYTVEKLLHEGARVLTMSDSNGTLYKKSGLTLSDFFSIQTHKNDRHGRLADIAKSLDADYLKGKTPWHIPCDLAFPCATQNEIDGDDAKQLIKHGCIGLAEGANMPSNQEAIAHYLKAKILYGPSKAANAGGVAMSGLEMAQNSMRQSWRKEELELRLREIMQNIHKTCLQHGHCKDSHYVNYLKGANIAGFKKVADSLVAYGVV